MATHIFGSGTLAIGVSQSPTDMYECQVGAFTVSSSANLIPIPATLCDGPSQAAQPSSWSLSMDILQDWGATDSLCQLLFDNDGTNAPLYFDYTPNDTAVPSCGGAFYAVAPDFGGAGNELWTSTEEMPMVDKPTLTPQV